MCFAWTNSKDAPWKDGSYQKKQRSQNNVDECN